MIGRKKANAKVIKPLRERKKDELRQKGRNSYRSKGKLVMLVGDEGAVMVHLVKGAVISRCYAASHDAEEIEQFKALSAQNSKLPLHLYFDNLDQLYVQQNLPPVASISVSKLIKRRLERDFSDDYIKGAIRIGREEGGRKDWKFMMVALQKNALVRSWLDVVLELSSTCTGVYLLPIESGQIFSRLFTACQDKKKKGGLGVPRLESASKESVGEATDKPSKKEKKKAGIKLSEINLKDLLNSRGKKGAKKSEWQIFVTHNKVSGIRQVVFHNRKMLLARLSQPATDATSLTVAGLIEQEIGSTREYLRRLGYTPGEDLTLLVITSDDVKQHIDISSITLTESFIVSPFEASELLGLNDAAQETDRYADTLLCAAVATNKRRILKLNTSELQKEQGYQYAAHGTRVAGVLILVYITYAIGQGVWQIYEIDNEIEDYRTRIISTQIALEDLRKNAQVPQEELDKITKVMDLYGKLKERSFSQDETMTTVAEVLRNGVRSPTYSWGLLGDPKRNPTNRKIQVTERAEIELEFYLERGDRDKLQQNTTDVLNALKLALPEHEIRYTKIPDIINDQNSIAISIGDDQNGSKPKEEEVSKPVFAKILIEGVMTAEVPDEQR